MGAQAKHADIVFAGRHIQNGSLIVFGIANLFDNARAGMIVAVEEDINGIDGGVVGETLPEVDGNINTVGVLFLLSPYLRTTQKGREQ